MNQIHDHLRRPGRPYTLVAGALLVTMGALVAPACDEPVVEEMQLPAPCAFAKTVVIAAGELVREKGSPWRDITVEIPTTGTYELTLENDGLAGFAVYTAEGEALISPDAFNAHPTSYTWTGELPAGEFVLRVRLGGKPGKRVSFELKRRISGPEATVVTAFTVQQGVAQEVGLCGGLTRLQFSVDALADDDASVDFIAKCTARECIDPGLASDRVEIHRPDDTGYVFKVPPAIEHPRVAHSARMLDGSVVEAVEGATLVINDAPMVTARSVIPHFSTITDDFPCGVGIPMFDIPFHGEEYVSQGNNNLEFTHKNDAGRHAIDFAVPLNTSILAVAKGQLHWAPGQEIWYGHSHLLLEIEPGKYYRYGHCEEPSPALVERGLKAKGSIQVAIGEEVCLSGNEGNTQGKAHLHVDLVALADPAVGPDGGASVPHGFIGLNHGWDSKPVDPPKLQVFCPDAGADVCTEDPVSLADECISPGKFVTDKTWTRVERSSWTCEMQAARALVSAQPFSDLPNYPNHPANKLRLAEATNQIYVGSPRPDCPFRPKDKQTRIETAKVLLTAAAGDSGILEAVAGYFDENDECRAALKAHFVDFDEIAAHWGRDVLAYTATVCNQPIAFFQGREHDDGLQYADLDKPILAIEAAKLLVELGREETLHVGDQMFEIPDGLNLLYDTYEKFVEGELDVGPYTDNADQGAWYVDYLDAMGHEDVQCPNGLGGFGIEDAMKQPREIHREEVADWLHRILQLTSDQRDCP